MPAKPKSDPHLATGRNAGFLLAGTSQSYAMAVRSHGRERARRLWEVSRDNHGLRNP